MHITEKRILNGPNIYLPCLGLVAILDTERSVLPVPYALAGLVRELVPSWSPDADWVKRLTSFPEGDEPKVLCEATVWLAMLVQREMGIPVRRGLVRTTNRERRFLVALEMETEPVVSGVFSLVVDLVSGVGEGTETRAGELFRALKQDLKENALDFDSLALARAARGRDVPWYPIDRRVVQLGQGCRQTLVLGAVTGKTPLIGGRLVQDKGLTTRILREQGFPVPRQQVVADSAAAVLAAERIGFPVVVKPLQGREGRGVSANLRNREEVAEAFVAASRYGQVVIESFVAGADFRLLVVNRELVAAARRVPAHVVGDGSHTVAQLVERANRDPIRDGVLLYRLTIGDAGRRMLDRVGLTPQSVPEAGRAVWLRSQANFSTGGTPEDATDQVHPEVRRLAVRVASVFGLDVCGVDYIAPDISRPPSSAGGSIIEVNARPGLRLHLVPRRGVARDVLSPILEALYPPGEGGRIPVVAVAGRQGRGTTARILSHFLEVAGKATGIVTDGYAWLSGKRLNRLPIDPFRGGEMLIRDPLTAALVMEVNDHDVVRDGLPVDRCDLAVATAMGDERESDTPVDGANHGLDAFRVSASIASRAIVANADSPRCLELVAKIDKDRLVLVATSKGNGRVASHVALGGTAAVMGESDELILYGNGREVLRKRLGSIPVQGERLGSGRFARSVLSAVAAGYALGLGLETLEEGLRSLTRQAAEAPLALRWITRRDCRFVLADETEPLTMAALSAVVSGLQPTGCLLLVGRADTMAALRLPSDKRIVWDGESYEAGASETEETAPTEAGAVFRAVSMAHSGDIVVIIARAMDTCMAALRKPPPAAIQEVRPLRDRVLGLPDLVPAESVLPGGTAAAPPAPVPAAHRAPLWTAEELRSATGGEWLRSPPPGWGATGINYYKGQIQEGDIAVATEPKTWNKKIVDTQHDLAELSRRRAACVIVSRRPSEMPPAIPVLLVKNTRTALDDIGRAARARLSHTRIIGITGSAGKTTTKEFVRHLLSRQAPTFGSRRNYNHGPGVALMLAASPRDARYGVYEFAVDTPDVTLRKAKILRPHVALITSIHPDHLMFYGTLEALSDQKCLLFDALEPGGIAVLNRDSNFFARQLDNARRKGLDRVISFGKSVGSDVRVLEADLGPEGSHVLASIFGEGAEFDIPQPGEYMILNCMAALAAVHAAGGRWKRALSDLPALPRLGQRNERYALHLAQGEAELVDDTFSSNPASVQAGLSVLKLMQPAEGGRKIAVMGEIKELGAGSKKLHADMAPAVKDAGVDFLFTIGPDIEPLREALGPSLEGFHCEDPGELGQAVARILRPGDIVWVKGSRRTPANLERIVSIITGAARKIRRFRRSATGPMVSTREMARVRSDIDAGDDRPKTKYSGPGQAMKLVAGKNGSRLEILFLGDTSFGENYQEKLEEAGRENILRTRGYDAPFKGVRDLLVGADLAIANLETPITDLVSSPFAGKKRWIHWTDVDKAPTHLLCNNIAVVTLANNHTFDFGAPGFDQTLDILQSREQIALGAGADLEAAGRPLLIEGEMAGETVVLAMIAACELPAEGQAERKVYAEAGRGGLNPLDPSIIADRIDTVRRLHPNAFVVVLPHWGRNYKWRTERQSRMGKALVSAGADLVIGHGAHMLQEMERIDGRWVLYGLGNFVFNSPGRYVEMKALPYSLIGRLVIEKADGVVLTRKLQVFPIVTDNRLTDYCTRPITAEELDEVVMALGSRYPGPERFTDLVRSGQDPGGNYYLEILL